MKTLFGPAGTAESFKTLGYKKTIQVPEYLSRFGLTAFEYQCGHGVRVGENSAKELSLAFQENHITPSLHAPYFISMSSVEEEKRLNSVKYILESARAVKAMGGKRVVFHSGSCGKISREEALLKATDTMKLMIQALDENDLGDIILCPETMGKVNQLGTLSEVLALAKVDKRIIPCIDFGHLNAREGGIIKTKKDYENILDQMELSLNDHRCVNFHSHFSKIQYTKGGEKCHLTFEDEIFGPEFEPLMELIYTRNLSPT
ncbi:MAG: TIM barrel protein, partial [Oscillospiraceae bacterium]